MDRSEDIMQRLKNRGLYEWAATIASYYRCTVREVCTATRDSHVSKARQFLWLIIRTQTQISYPGIGKLWGVDHTSVMYGVKKLEVEFGISNPELFNAKIREILPTLDVVSMPIVQGEPMKRFVVRGYVNLPIVIVVDASNGEQAKAIASKRKLRSLNQTDHKEWRVATTGEEPIEILSIIQAS